MLWPKREPRLANGDFENLFEDSDLGDLHPDDRADILHEGLEGRGSRASTRAARSTFSASASLQSTRGRVELGANDRSINRMLQELGAAADVARVIATKRNRRGRDPLFEVLARRPGAGGQ